MAKKKKIEWTKIRVKLGDIDAWEENPKHSTKEQAERIVESEQEFGQPLPFVLEPEKKKRFPLIDGHQRKAAWESVHGSEFIVDAVVSSRKLTLKEKKKFIVYFHVSATGSIDWDKMSSWNTEDLIGWGLDKKQKKEWDNDANNLKEMMRASGMEEKYNLKLNSPVYEPSDEKPSLEELFDCERTELLIQEIDLSSIPDDEKAFLRMAAQRHNVLYFSKIADFYAHSSRETQALMENNALVIIDFKKAIEKGYVILTERIKELVKEELNND